MVLSIENASNALVVEVRTEGVGDFVSVEVETVLMGQDGNGVAIRGYDGSGDFLPHIGGVVPVAVHNLSF